MASVLTLAAGVAATFGAYVREVSHPWPRLGAALALGTAAEIVGLATGFPFGRYVYTGDWWPSVALPVGSFPLPLPFAWLLMAGASCLAVRSAWLGGLLAALVDLAMEPVMAGPLHYWRWPSPGPLPGGAPIANFLGWWGTATLAGLILMRGAPPRPEAPRWVLAGFVVLLLGLGLIVR